MRISYLFDGDVDTVAKEAAPVLELDGQRGILAGGANVGAAAAAAEKHAEERNLGRNLGDGEDVLPEPLQGGSRMRANMCVSLCARAGGRV